MSTYKSQGTGRAALKGVGKGAMTGATIGSMIPIPGVGTAVGALIGAVVGGIGSLFKKRRSNVKAHDKDVAQQRQANVEFEQVRLAQKFQPNPMASPQQAGPVYPAAFSSQEARKIQNVFDLNQETYGSMFMQQS